VIPSVGPKLSAWLSVHLIASDLASSGVSPQFAMLDLNLPPQMDLADVEEYVESIGESCEALGISIAGGHTGRYPGSGYTVVGGGTMLSVAREDAYVTPAMARPGDSVVMTKGAAIGAAAVLSHAFPETVGSRSGAGTLRRARSRLKDCSTVKDALAAAAVGLHKKVTSMHDATEGGVLGGLFELSSASGLQVFVDTEKVQVPDDVRQVCQAFDLDPLVTLSEGTLLITSRQEAVGEVIEGLADEGVEALEIGRTGKPGGGLFVSSGGSSPKRRVPGPDRYWEAYSKAVKEGLQ
jgi:hydrogenase expression/formation protein HypE